MLKVTIDAFSGRENPSWVLDEKDEQDLLKDLARNRGMVGEENAGYSGLGFRGIIVEAQTDDFSDQYGLPMTIRLAGGASDNEAKGLETAERIIKSARKYASKAEEAVGYALDKALEDLILQQLDRIPGPQATEETDGTAKEEAGKDVSCPFMLCRFNPGFWNDAAHITRNNCYNYASNKRTDTFAQPGRGSGHPISTLSCPDVSRAAMSDGLHRRFDCFPASEQPIWLVALVVAPNYDYHWYRKQREGFWGHKPGRTAARNTDNNNRVVLNPETCARAPYTNFCGYLYVPRSQRIR